MKETKKSSIYIEYDWWGELQGTPIQVLKQRDREIYKLYETEKDEYSLKEYINGNDAIEDGMMGTVQWED